jgi:hypothetical protein
MRAKPFVLAGLAGLALLPITYFVLDPAEVFAPTWVGWVGLTVPLVPVVLLYRALDSTRTIATWERHQSHPSRKNAEVGISKISAITALIPITFGSFVVRATGQFPPYFAYLVLSLFTGLAMWKRATSTLTIVLPRLTDSNG